MIQGIELQRQGELSLARQIYQTIRKQILAGRLLPGEILPSTREMAAQLAVSRNTTYEAYEMLRAEGYIFASPGAPTRVTPALQLTSQATTQQQNLHLTHSPVQRSKPFLPLNPAHIMQAQIPNLTDFRTGRPELRCFPCRLWLQLLRQSAENQPLKFWNYSGPSGLAALRAEISAWLFRSRGLDAAADDIFITAGATQGLYLLAALLAANKKQVLIEDPCHRGMLQVFRKQGYSIKPLPADNEGLQTDALTDSDGRQSCCIYVTPSHQFPLGGILSASRRTALVRFARKHSLYIIEDDYDSEFRYSGPPIAPLHTMSQAHVIYVGTFSKILFPALRIGYVILPRQLHQRWRQLRTYADVQNPPFEQAALAEYLRSRKLDRHINKMRHLYSQRRQTLLQSATVNFSPDSWQVWGDNAGLHLSLAFPGLNFTQKFIRQCKSKGLIITPVSYHSIQPNLHTEKLLLGYGHLEPAEINQGISLLAKCLKNLF